MKADARHPDRRGSSTIPTARWPITHRARAFDMSTRYRLHRRRDIARVFAQGRVASDAVLLVRGAANDLGHCRMAPLASRRQGGAVVRNRWKRRVREAFRRALPELPPGIDLAVMARGEGVPQVAALAESLAKLARQLARRLPRSEASPESRP